MTNKLWIAPLLALAIINLLPFSAAAQGTPPWVRTILVRPGGGPVASGQRLLAAINAIGQPSQADPWLIKLEPGIYDLRGATLNLRSYVDIEGSGRNTTVIQSTGAGAAPVVACTNANWSEVRNLTVSNLQTSASSVAFQNRCTWLRIANVLIRAEGQQFPRGFESLGGFPMIEELSVWVFNGRTGALAVRVDQTGAKFRNLDILMQSNAGWTRGLQITSHGNVVDIQGLRLAVAGGSPATGLYAFDGAAEIRNANISAGTSNNPAYGIVAAGNSVVRYSGSILGSGTPGYGVWAFGPTNYVYLSNSEIWGGTNSIRKDGDSSVMAGASQLINPAVTSGGGILRCTSSFSLQFLPLNGSCQ